MLRNWGAGIVVSMGSNWGFSHRGILDLNSKWWEGIFQTGKVSNVHQLKHEQKQQQNQVFPCYQDTTQQTGDWCLNALKVWGLKSDSNELSPLE